MQRCTRQLQNRPWTANLGLLLPVGDWHTAELLYVSLWWDAPEKTGSGFQPFWTTLQWFRGLWLGLRTRAGHHLPCRCVKGEIQIGVPEKGDSDWTLLRQHLQRAEANVKACTNHSIPVIPINKYLPGINTDAYIIEHIHNYRHLSSTYSPTCQRGWHWPEKTGGTDSCRPLPPLSSAQGHQTTGRRAFGQLAEIFWYEQRWAYSMNTIPPRWAK